MHWISLLGCQKISFNTPSLRSIQSRLKGSYFRGIRTEKRPWCHDYGCEGPLAFAPWINELRMCSPHCHAIWPDPHSKNRWRIGSSARLVEIRQLEETFRSIHSLQAFTVTARPLEPQEAGFLADAVFDPRCVPSQTKITMQDPLPLCSHRARYDVFCSQALAS